MANYVFEEMSDSDAVGFDGSTDRLFFQTATVTTLGVVDNPGSSGPLGSTNETVTLTSGAITHTFLASELATASTNNSIIFVHGSSTDAFAIGTTVDNTSAALADVDVGGHVAIYGLASNDHLGGTVGNDTINGGAGDDTIQGASDSTDGDGNVIESDYLMGGNGADSIVGGIGNDHIYGNLFSSTAGAADGNDTISAGDGVDYVNGNAGNDLIDGGANNDRLYGGAGNDTVTGATGNDYIQGNKGNDSLAGGADNDVIHGGADNDTISGDAGNDQIFGDNGNDSVTGGAGYDQLWGGAGNDTFSFGTAGDASNANVHTASTATDHGLVDVINDFTDGSDHIHLTFVPAAAANIHHTVGATFTDAAAAQDYAQTQLTGHGSDVAAITVGSDTYLFYDDTHTTGVINSAIKIVGVTDASITVSDFI